MKKQRLYIYMALDILLLLTSIILFIFDRTVIFSNIEYVIFMIAFGIHSIVLAYFYFQIDNDLSDRVFMFADWVRFVSFSLMLLLLPIMFFVSFPTVQQDSMLETLHPNDKVLVYHYNFDIQRDDIVVAYVDGSLIVKRVAAVPGDHITFSDRDESGNYRIYINGILYDYQWDDDYEVSHYQFAILNDLDDQGYVKDHQYILLGDNQNVSYDSWGFGTVDQDQIYGRVIYKLWPFGGIS